jgi:hypothetical protein
VESDWDKQGSKIVDNLFELLKDPLNSAIKDSLTASLKKALYFVSFSDLTRYILMMLEQKFNLSDKAKNALVTELEKIYKDTQANFFSENKLPIKQELNTADVRAIQYALELHDFYLGKFFQNDKNIRLRVSKWFSDYYLKEGNPIGKGQKGVEEFLNQFGDYIRPQAEWKARQIIDTSVNYMRNSARIRAIQEANITTYRISAIGDRLTCSICRSYDGREFETKETVRLLDTIESSDAKALADYKPFVGKPYTGASTNAPSKLPPFHAHCRCRVSVSTQTVEIPTTVERPSFAKNTLAQKELEEEYKSLTRKEIQNKIKAHLGSDWLRPTKGGKGTNAYEKAKDNLEKHFERHGKELGYKNIEKYKMGVYNVIKNPDAVYVERKNGQTWYHFIKDGKLVLSSDDSLWIKNFYPFDEKRWKSFERDGLLRIL